MEYAECEKCGFLGLIEAHHRFSKYGWVEKLYGNLIHHPKNIQCLCYDCHHNKPLDKWSEKEFCEALGIEPRSKQAKNSRLAK